MNGRIWRRALRILRYLAAISLALLTLAYGYETVYGFTHAVDIDPTDRCEPFESGHCFAEQAGVVGDSGSWYDVRVRYDDGRRSMGLYLNSDSPPKSTRVRIESWDGDVVSLYDPARERRYRTHDWPERWAWNWIGTGILTLVLSLVVWPGAVRRVRRLVKRRAGEASP